MPLLRNGVEKRRVELMVKRVQTPTAVGELVDRGRSIFVPTSPQPPTLDSLARLYFFRLSPFIRETLEQFFHNGLVLGEKSGRPGQEA